MESTRTRESEIAANISFWKRRGIKISKKVVTIAIMALPEREGMNFYLVIPKGITCQKLWKMIGKEMPTHQTMENEAFKFYSVPRDSKDKTYAVATRPSQRSDYGSRYVLPLALESELTNYMTPSEYIVAAMRWYEETGTHLDEHSVTIFPRSRMSTGYMPEMDHCDHDELCVTHEGVNYCSGRSSSTNVGPREVIAEGLPQTDPIPYQHETPFHL